MCGRIDKDLILILALSFLSACAYMPDPEESDRQGVLERLALLEPAHNSRNMTRIEPKSPTIGVRAIRKLARGWSAPLKDVVLTSKFGQRGKRFHEGVDFRARVGTPVYSVANGKVVYSGARVKGYGRMVVIEHAGGLYSVYAHHSKNYVKVGQKVKQGQRIALSGRSGRVTGPHLHFEIRKGPTPLDPKKVLRL